MDNRYQSEIEDFKAKFHMYQKQRIVLYGIGRYTATLVDGLKNYHIVGLMDKDPKNIGKTIFGLPVLSKEEAQEKADLIIINTAGTYWNVIYRRIMDMSVPIYFRNGEPAKVEEMTKIDIPYWKTSLEELQGEIVKADIVSFDFFDTLYSRMVCNPKDIFQLMDIKVSEKYQMEESFSTIRTKALQHLNENYKLEELYEQIEILGHLSKKAVNDIKTIELELESKLLVQRTPIVECMKEAILAQKDVYIISDMYLPKSFYIEKLKEYNIELPEEKVLISCELRKSKQKGDLWKYYHENIVGNRKALHIGDNENADIINARQLGISSYYIANNMTLLENSSMNAIASQICTLYDSMIMGCILNQLFSDPFILNKKSGKVQITTYYDMGYCVFGPVIYTFFQWLLKEIKEDGVERIIFMARDGYLLKEDFEFYTFLCGETVKTEYIGISRQLAMTAAVENKKDLLELIHMPYSGTVAEMLEDRFDIKIIGDENKILIEQYVPRIKSYVHKVRMNYQKYLEQFEFDEKCAIVDIGYYGNNQKYLKKLCKKDIKGYYFNANLSLDNPNAKEQMMKACFQEKNDLLGERSGILQKQIYIESLLTAPYGMIQEVDETGKFICKEKKMNQICFENKRKINEGIKEFIRECAETHMERKMEENIMFINAYYELCFSGRINFSEMLKKSFYNDNAFMNRLESTLFY